STPANHAKLCSVIAILPTTHGPSRRLPFLYWRSRRNFLLGIHRDQPAGAHVLWWCFSTGRFMAAPGVLARLVSLHQPPTKRRQGYRKVGRQERQRHEPVEPKPGYDGQ